jgi:hypothetical protein
MKYEPTNSLGLLYRTKKKEGSVGPIMTKNWKKDKNSLPSAGFLVVIVSYFRNKPAQDYYYVVNSDPSMTACTDKKKLVFDTCTSKKRVGVAEVQGPGLKCFFILLDTSVSVDYLSLCYISIHTYIHTWH